MVVTQDPELVARLSKMNAAVMGSTSDPFYGAPTVIIVFSDSKMGTCVENGSLVMGNLMNAAALLSAWTPAGFTVQEKFLTPRKEKS